MTLNAVWPFPPGLSEMAVINRNEALHLERSEKIANFKKGGLETRRAGLGQRQNMALSDTLRIGSFYL